MKKSLTQSLLSVFFSVFLVAGISSAAVAQTQTAKINDALAKKNLTEVQNLLKSGPGNVDEVIRALLKTTQNVMATDPDFSNRMMSLAGDYATQITPPTVPAVCADLRRIVSAFKPEQVGSPLFMTVLEATQKFAKAPVVVAQGRPNLCEDAFLLIATLSGDEALLAQLPGMRGPGLFPVMIDPGIKPAPTVKPSAD